MKENKLDCKSYVFFLGSQASFRSKKKNQKYEHKNYLFNSVPFAQYLRCLRLYLFSLTWELSLRVPRAE